MDTPIITKASEDDVSIVVDRIERDVVSLFRENPGSIWGVVALLFVLIVSPLFVFWITGEWAGKEWSETVNNVVESLALMVAAFGVFKWLDERRNRATDVLLLLERHFQKKDVMVGRKMVEDSDYDKLTRSDQLDCMLRFYVLLYGVLRAKQVPEISLSICFRYWLAHYFRKDRPGFRRYVDYSYPTISSWLRQDCHEGLSFFRPHRLFPGNVDEEFIEKC